MPELPEVQTVVNDLIATGLIGKMIVGTEVHWNKTIAPLKPDEFGTKIARQTIARIWRRGKYIVLDFQSDLHLLIHLRMTGQLQLVPHAHERGKHEHIVLQLNDGGDLRYHDTRKFGRMTLTKNPNTVFAELGPEPFDQNFTCHQFKSMLKSRHRRLKPLLLDQTFIAGLGNIYADEALWEAKLHPLKIAATLSPRKVTDLYHAIRKVLQRGIDHRGTSLGTGKTNFASAGRRRGGNIVNLKVFHRTDQACPRCRTKIKRIVVGQRSTHICPKCQKL
jgi:formamidopyrimidine-DNA glycosylase